jgi:hypothetical protein
VPAATVRRPREDRPNPRASGEDYSRFLLRYTSAPSPETRARVELARVRKELRQFLRTQTPRIVLIAAIGFGIGWFMNFRFMRKKYEGFNVPKFAPVSGQGSRVIGMLFWFVLSTVVFAFIGMLRKRGRAKVKDQIFGAPARVRTLVQQDKQAALRHLLWGFAGAMLVMLVLGPALTGLISASFLLFMGTAFRRLAMGVLMVTWRWVVTLVAPERAKPPDPAAATVGALGGPLAMFVGMVVVPGQGGRFAVAAAAAVGAVVVGQKQVAARTALLLIGGMATAVLWVGVGTALADDGGEAECAGRVRGCAGVDKLAKLAALGGAAAGAGAVVGAAVGEAVTEDEEDDDVWPPGDDGVPCEDGGEAEASDWETWSLAHPKGSWAQFMAERIERSRQAALAKERELDALAAEFDRLDAEFERLQKKLKTDFEPTKPWNEMNNAEKAVAKAHLTRTWRQANPTADPTEFMQYLQRLDADPDLTTADMFQYIVGESVLGLPGATWDATKKTFTDAKGAVMGAKEFTGNLFDAYMEDALSGEQADRLGRTFIDPIGQFWDDFHDRGPSAMLADMRSSGIKVTQSGVKAFDGAMQQLHNAMITGDGAGIAKVIDGAAGSIISEYLLSLGSGAVVGLAKKGVTAMRAGKAGGLTDDVVRAGEEFLAGDSIPLDTEAKRRAVGHSEQASKGFQEAVDKSGNKLQMQRRAEDAIDHEGKAYMKPQGGKYSKSVNSLDKHLGGPDEEGLLAFYEPIDPLAAPGSPLQKRYETVRTLFDSVPGSNLAEKQSYLTKNRLEVWVNGEKTKIPVAFDSKGIMRHAQTGRPITSDYDGWAVLDQNGRRLGYDDAGQRLTGAAKQADRKQKIPMIRDLVNDPRTNLQHAPTSSEWGPIPAILAGDLKKACSSFSCAINKIGDNIVDAARKDGVVEYRPGEAHPYLTKAAGVKDAKAPTLTVKGKARPMTTAEKVKAEAAKAPAKLASSAMGDVRKETVKAADKAATQKAANDQKAKTPTKPTKTATKAPKK